jgi:hypothetical protein
MYKVNIIEMHWREKNEDLGSGNSFQKSTGVK